MSKALVRVSIAVLLMTVQEQFVTADPPGITYGYVTDMGASNGVRTFVYAYGVDVPTGCEVYWVRGGWVAPGGADAQYETNTHNATGWNQVTGSFTFDVPDFSGEWCFWLQVRYYTNATGDDILYGDDIYLTIP